MKNEKVKKNMEKNKIKSKASWQFVLECHENTAKNFTGHKTGFIYAKYILLFSI